MKRYPFERHYLKLQCGHRMHYLDEGSGPILLMLHGNPTWSFYYRNLVLGLRDQYRCIVPDHVGCGLSDKPERWSYGIRDHTDNITDLLTTLDLRDATLVVHDWGGAIGYLAATRTPDRFRRFITFNTAVSLLPLPRILTMLRSRILGSLIIRGLNGMVRAGLLSSALHGHRFHRDVRAGYLAPYDSWAHRIALLRFVQEIPLEANHPNRTLLDDLVSRLEQFTLLPHLIVWGLKDPIFHRDYLAAWRRQFPGADVHALADASHWVVEEAHERILPLVQEFLTRTDCFIT
ncbi:MAG: alpha/beta fold hydrolase [Gemmatimonadales bacterium]